MEKIQANMCFDAVFLSKKHTCKNMLVHTFSSIFSIYCSLLPPHYIIMVKDHFRQSGTRLAPAELQYFTCLQSCTHPGEEV